MSLREINEQETGEISWVSWFRLIYHVCDKGKITKRSYLGIILNRSVNNCRVNVNNRCFKISWYGLDSSVTVGITVVTYASFCNLFNALSQQHTLYSVGLQNK